MKKQKHVEATNLTDVLNQLEDNTNKYQTIMFDFNRVLVGNVYISRYNNIDPEKSSEQYLVCFNDNCYKILPNNNIWMKRNSDTDYIMMNFSANKAENMWYQVNHIFQSTINANLKKYMFNLKYRELMLMIIASVLSCLVMNGVQNVTDNKSNKIQNKTETPAKPNKTQTNPVDTIVYNASQHTK